MPMDWDEFKATPKAFVSEDSRCTLAETTFFDMTGVSDGTLKLTSNAPNGSIPVVATRRPAYSTSI